MEPFAGNFIFGVHIYTLSNDNFKIYRDAIIKIHTNLLQGEQEYINYYNTIRQHSAIDYQSPTSVEKTIEKDFQACEELQRTGEGRNEWIERRNAIRSIR